MADDFLWIGGATAVAQVWTGSIDTVDGTPANNTFTVTIGGVAVTVTGDTNVATTATALRAALNASTHPYFSTITWSGATGDIIGTADTAGVPFLSILTKAGAGTGMVTNFAVTTANAGPHSWTTGNNWYNVTDNTIGAAPVATDNIILRDTDDDILWNLDQSAIAFGSVRIFQSYAGKLGLDTAGGFATVETAVTVNTSYREYRQAYLKLDGAVRVEIGENYSGTVPAGSQRVMIDLGNDAYVCVVHRTASSPSETGKPVVRLRGDDTAGNVYVRSAQGGVGLAMDAPGETMTAAGVFVNGASASDRVYGGSGLTLTTWEQDSGSNVLRSAATITTINVNGGELLTEGSYVVTTGNAKGGIWRANHISGSVAFTTLNIDGGVVDALGSNEARTWTTVNAKKGTLRADANRVTITTLNEGDSGKYDLSIA